MRTMRNTLIVVMTTAALLGTNGAALLAGEDHDQAKMLKEAGIILPLEQILEKANKRRPGHVVETELERKRSRYIYEIKIVDDKGMVWELKYDAATGELLEDEQES